MGRQIPRLSRGSGVASADAPAHARPESGPRQAESFGAWLGRERRLRDISIEFVAARTKLPPERIRAVEAGTAPLGSDGRSRALARTLARAIGADPEEASARLPEPLATSGGEPRGEAARTRAFRLPAWRLPGGRVPVGLLATVLGALGLGLAAWGVAVWLERPPSAAETPEVIYRRDYLKQLDGPGR